MGFGKLLCRLQWKDTNNNAPIYIAILSSSLFAISQNALHHSFPIFTSYFHYICQLLLYGLFVISSTKSNGFVSLFFFSPDRRRVFLFFFEYKYLFMCVHFVFTNHISYNYELKLILNENEAKKKGSVRE